MRKNHFSVWVFVLIFAFGWVSVQAQSDSFKELLSIPWKTVPADQTARQPSNMDYEKAWNRFDVSKFCSSDGHQAVGSLTSLIPWSNWDVSFFLWVNSKKSFLPSHYKRVGSKERKQDELSKKVLYLLDAFRQQEPQLALPKSFFVSYELLKAVQQQGLERWIPRYAESETGEKIKLPVNLRTSACVFTRDVILEELQNSPLTMGQNFYEMEQLVLEVDRKSKALADFHREVARPFAQAILQTLPRSFASHYGYLYEWREFLRQNENEIPFHYTWPAEKEWEEQTWPPNQVEKTRLYQEFIREEEQNVDALLGAISFLDEESIWELAQLGNPFYSDQERKTANPSYSPLNSEYHRSTATKPDEYLADEIQYGLLSRKNIYDRWYEKLFDSFLVYQFSKNPKVKNIHLNFLQLFMRDYLNTNQDSSFVERNISPRLSQINYQNQQYEISLRAMRMLRSPQLLSALLQMASLDFKKFPAWVRDTIESNPHLTAEQETYINAWLQPKRKALFLILINLSSYSDNEFDWVSSWVGNQLFSLQQQCLETGCQKGSYKAALVKEFQEYLVAIYGKRVEHSLVRQASSGSDTYRKPIPDLENIDFQSEKANWAGNKNELKYFGPRMAWAVLDHPIQTAVVLGSMVLIPYVFGAITVRATVGAVGLGTKLFVGAIAINSFLFFSQTGSIIFLQMARMMVGAINPNSRFAVTGPEFSRSWVAVMDQVLLFSFFIYGGKFVNTSVNPKVTGAINTIKGLGKSYRTLGLRFGSSHDECRIAFRRLIKNLHPDKNRQAWEQKILINQYEEVVKAWELLDGFFGGAKKIRASNATNGVLSFFQEVRRFNQSLMNFLGRATRTGGMQRPAPALLPLPIENP